MLELDANNVILLTIVAAFSQSVVLAITLFVFYKNLVVLKKHNEMTIKRFTFQSNVEKYDLTLKFADWVKSEHNDYLPYAIGDVEHEHLTKGEIKEHFDHIAKNMVHLVNEEIVYKSLMFDEIKKMYVTLENMNKDDPAVMQLKSLIK